LRIRLCANCQHSHVVSTKTTDYGPQVRVKVRAYRLGLGLGSGLALGLQIGLGFKLGLGLGYIHSDLWSAVMGKSNHDLI